MQTMEHMKFPKLFNGSHSFGFDCKKRSNLLVVSSEIIVFTTGNFLQVLNVKSKEQVNIHTTHGGGMGAIAVSSDTFVQRFSLIKLF